MAIGCAIHGDLRKQQIRTLGVVWLADTNAHASNNDLDSNHFNYNTKKVIIVVMTSVVHEPLNQ